MLAAASAFRTLNQTARQDALVRVLEAERFGSATAPMKTPELETDAMARLAASDCSVASASDSRIAKPKEQWCLKGHSAICDSLCKLWCCKYEHQQALAAKPLNE